MSARRAVNLDWTRDPVPSSITQYQQYVRNVDWSQTTFGPMRSWSRELRQMVLFMMAEVNPVILYWGEQRTMMYNEAYVPLVGKRHPQIQGMNAMDAFPDFWGYFDDIISEQQMTGKTHVGEASMLIMTRHGFREETYFNWKMIPVIGEDGTMLGSYGRPTESTNEVINSRRGACIQSLAHQTGSTLSIDDLWSISIKCLGQNDKDIPMAMVYSLSESPSKEGSSEVPVATAKLEAVLGIPEGHPCTVQTLELQHGNEGLVPLLRLAHERGNIFCTPVAEAGLLGFFAGIDWRGFGVPVEELVLLPIKINGQVTAVIVIGINPRLRFTGQYQDFIRMVGEVLSPQISKIRLAEEVKTRDQIAQRAVMNFQRSEIKFARFATRSPLGLTLTDRDGNILYANESWYSFCGLSPEKNEFSNWVDTVWEDDLVLVNEWWHKVTNLKQSGTFQIRSKEPFVSGHMSMPYRTAIVAIYPDLDDEGNVASVMGLVTDISELKWTEEQLLLRQRELEESEKKYRDFAEHAPIGVVRTDANGFILFANDTWRSFYNVPRDHTFQEAQPWLASLYKEDVPLAQQFFNKFSNKKGSGGIEVRLNRFKNASEGNRASTPMPFWLLSTGFTEYNADGSINNMVFWVTDISDQKAAEKVLTDKMEEAIRLKNTQERFVDMISHEIRNPLSAILHCSEEIADSMKHCSILVDGLPNGKSMPDHSSAQLSIKTHIQSALDAANTILYCVQHQKQIVDDVLTLSKLDADLLVVSPIPVQPTELVKSALKIFEPELKASAIELAFEIDSSLQELDIDWIMLDPNRFLQIVINLITNAIKFTRNSTTRRIVVSVHARTEPPPRQYQNVDYVPRRETDRVFDNSMLDNGFGKASTESLYLCFSVADTGQGLGEAERITLFNRFTQASPKTHVEYGGSGLGLFISRQITEMLGGEIGVGSEPGKGATFAFYLRTRRATPPRRASSGVEPVSVYTKTLVTPTPGTWIAGQEDDDKKAGRKLDRRPIQPTPEPITSKRRVLVVEDNLVNQKVLCKQLRNRGFMVEASNHGREALDSLEKAQHEKASRFDIILCDIEMPVMDGIQCVTEIRRLEKEGVFQGHIPIIGVTANVRSKQVNAAIEAGMDGVTTKPYRIDELIAHIDRVSADVENLKKLAAAPKPET